MENSTGVILIGNYLEPVISLLDNANINIDMVISTCNILAMEGKSDLSILKKYLFGYAAQRENFSSGSIINMFKDLSKRISRNPQDFDNVFRFSGEKKRTNYNRSDYVVVMNTCMGYAVFEKNGVVYSDTYPQNRFIKDINDTKNSEYKKYTFPFPDEFNWKYYYDKFINAILSAYDSEHIILIRTNAAQWYTDGDEIKAFNDISVKYRNRIQQIDDYFVEKTYCRTVNEHYCFIPPENRPCAFTYAIMDDMAYRTVSDGIFKMISSDYSFDYRSSHYVNPLAKRIVKSFTSQTVDKNAKAVENIGKADSNNVNEEFAAAIKKLNIFIAEENYRLSDHAFKLLEQDSIKFSNSFFEMLDYYTEYMKLDINDIIAVYKLYSRCEKKEKFKKIIKNIIDNHECIPVRNALKTKEKNLKILNEYRYTSSELISEGDETICVFVNTYHYIKINSDRSVMEHITLNPAEKINFFDIREKGYICSPWEATAVGSSLEFFILKNKLGDKDTPLFVKFDSAEEFTVTLFSVDYESLLNNENFVLMSADGGLDLSDYESKVDISGIVTPIKEGELSKNDCLSQIQDMSTIKSLYDDDRLPPDLTISKNIMNSLNDPVNKRRLETYDKINNINQGFALTVKYLSCEPGVHYFIKGTHLGDNTRSFQFISYFKSYHTLKKSFPINKTVLLTTANYADFAKAYRDIDEIMILPKDELLMLNEFALSGIGNFNLYADTFRLIKSWGTPNICEIYKIPEDYVFSNPELYRFPEKLSDISVDSAKRIFKENDIDPKRTVIIFPYAQTSTDLSPNLFSEVVEFYKKQDFVVFTNVGLNEQELPGTRSLNVPADVVLAMGSMGCIMIGVQSGMMDSLEWLNINFRFLFISPLNNFENVRMFLNKYKLPMAAPLPHSLEQRIEPRKGGIFVAASNESEFKRLPEDIIEQSKYFIKGNLQRCRFTQDSLDLSIYGAKNLNDYISEAVGLEDVVFFISVCDSANKWWTKFESRKLLGLQTDLSTVWRLSYVAVVDLQEKICLEKVDNKWTGTNIQYVSKDTDSSDNSMSGEDLKAEYGKLPKDNYCYLYSCGMDKQRFTESNIIINGEDYSLNWRGLNIVLYSKRHGYVIDSINVDTFGDPELTVRRGKTAQPTEEENIK